MTGLRPSLLSLGAWFLAGFASMSAVLLAGLAVVRVARRR